MTCFDILKTKLAILLIASFFVSSCDSKKGNTENSVEEEQFMKIQTSDKWIDFVPKNFKVQDTVMGDLNNDGLLDILILVKDTDPKYFVIDEYNKPVDRNRRGLIILFKSKNSYDLIANNLSCFYSENEDGGVYFPPELSIEIVKNVINVHFAHGRYGFWTYKFRYQNDDFELIGYDSSSNNGPVVMSHTSINYSTGKKIVKKNINVDAEEDGQEVFETSTTQVKRKQKIKLSEITNIEDLYLSED